MKCWNICRRKRLGENWSFNEQKRSGKVEMEHWRLHGRPGRCSGRSPIILLLFRMEVSQEKGSRPSASSTASGTSFTTLRRLRAFSRSFHQVQRPLQRIGRCCQRHSVFTPNPSILHDFRLGKIRLKSRVGRLHQRPPRRRRRQSRRRVGLVNFALFWKSYKYPTLFSPKNNLPPAKICYFGASKSPPIHLQTPNWRRICGFKSTNHEDSSTVHQVFHHLS